MKSGAPASYNLIAQLLHWLTVGLLVAQFAVAWTMPEVHRDTKPIDLIAWHLSIGLTILLVVLIRAGWRAVSAVPPPPDDLPNVLRLLSRTTHFLLYAILVVLPVLGWINANARGWDVRLFGQLKLPALVATGTPWARGMGDIHMDLAIVLLVVVGLHVLGALYHQFILRDGLVGRMLPGA